MKKLLVSLLCFMMTLGITNVKAEETLSGWVSADQYQNYYVDGEKVTNKLMEIDGKYYYFDRHGTMQTKTTKVGKTTYFLSKKGVLLMRKVGKAAYYDHTNKRIDYWDGYEYETVERAKKIVARITKPSDSMATKRLKAFKWVEKFNYKTRRRFSFKKGWIALYANDHFLKPSDGDCRSDACAFAYLAYVIGYKDVRVCCSSRKLTGKNHAFTEINGRVYDPLFAQAASFKRNYNVTYKTYFTSKAIDFKIPYSQVARYAKNQ